MYTYFLSISFKQQRYCLLLHIIWKIRTRHLSNYWKTKDTVDPSNVVKLLSNCFLFYFSFVYIRLLKLNANWMPSARKTALPMTAIRLAVFTVSFGIFVPLLLLLPLLHFRLIFFSTASISFSSCEWIFVCFHQLFSFVHKFTW